MALGFTQPLTEMSIRNPPRGKEPPTRKASDCLESVGCFDVPNTYGPPRPVTGIETKKYGGVKVQLHHT
jgi:hypothetical protein